MKFIIFLFCSVLFLMTEVELFRIVIPNFTPKICKNYYRNCRCPSKAFKSYCIIVEPFGVENPICLSNSTNETIILTCIKLSTSFSGSSESDRNNSYGSNYYDSSYYDDSNFSIGSLDSNESDSSSDYSSGSTIFGEEDSSYNYDSSYSDNDVSDVNDFLVITTVINGKRSNDSSKMGRNNTDLKMRSKKII